MYKLTSMKTLFALLFLITLTTIPITKVNGQRKRMVGTRTNIEDVKTNKEVQELGKFAVEQYNRKILPQAVQAGPLVFLQVVEAQRQVVAGLKYYLKVEAMHGNDELSRTFYAEVVVKPWLQSKDSKHLLTFGPSTY